MSDSLLFDRARYQKVFQRLAIRGRERREVLYSSPVAAELNLKWVLENEGLVTRTILSCLKKEPENILDTCEKRIILTDKPREIWVSSWPDRILLMVIGDILTEAVNAVLSPHVFSFQKGKGQFTALHHVKNFLKANIHLEPLFLLRRDIKSYGETIVQGRLFSQLEEIGISHKSLLFQLVKKGVQVEFSEAHAKEVRACNFLGLPTGSPLTPPLENLYLTPLDDHCSLIPLSCYARFGDDFIVLTSSQEVAQEQRSKLETLITGLGLHFHPDKTKDIALLNRSHLFAEFKSGPFFPAISFEWLGARISKLSLSGPKPLKMNTIRNGLKRDVLHLLTIAHSTIIGEEEKRVIIQQGLTQIVDPKFGSEIWSALTFCENKTLLVQLDQLLLKTFVCQGSRIWKTNKKTMWKYYKSFRDRSFVFHWNILRKKREKRNESSQSKAA